MTSLLVVVGRLCREADKRQKGLAETLRVNAQKVQEITDIIDLISKEEALRTPVVRKLIGDIKDVTLKFKHHLERMNKTRKRLPGFIHQLVKGQTEQEIIIQFFEELVATKQNLALHIQLIHVSLTNQLGTTIEGMKDSKSNIQKLKFQVKLVANDQAQVEEFSRWASHRGLTGG